MSGFMNMVESMERTGVAPWLQGADEMAPRASGGGAGFSGRAGGQDEPKWALHIPSLRAMRAAPSLSEARRVADGFNAAWAAFCRSSEAINGAYAFDGGPIAFVVEWPGRDASHAEGAARWNPEEFGVPPVDGVQ